MTNLLSFLKRSFILEIKKTIAYPTSFWLIVITFPLYSLIQIVFLESIYSHTGNFAGYTKYEGYILFGTFTMVQTLGYLFFHLRLADLKTLINGGGQESFDVTLIKPIDAQIYATLGRFNFGNIAPCLVAFFVMLYGLSHETHLISLFGIFSYILILIMGTIIFYITFLFFQVLLFWFPDLQVTESIWESFQEFGQYPAGLYQGFGGIILNLVIPITLMASIPVDFILGRGSVYFLFIYIAIILILSLLSRLFWSTAIKKYSSFSS
jgi:ABC-2 type transport system permease protein